MYHLTFHLLIDTLTFYLISGVLYLINCIFLSTCNTKASIFIFKQVFNPQMLGAHVVVD